MNIYEIGIPIIAFLLGLIITRLVFGIHVIVRNMEAQTKLLIKLAENNNVPNSQILEIMADCKFRKSANGSIIKDK